MREGDLTFFCGVTFHSRMIRARTSSMFSHVGMIVHLNSQLWVAESIEGHGLRVVPLDVWSQWQGEILIGMTNLTFGQRVMAARWMLAHVGSPYASGRQFVRSFSWIWRRIARRVRRRVDVDPAGYTCSEAVATALRSAVGELPDPPAAMTPADVAALPLVTSFVKWPTASQ